jgi:hypothetical protein
MSVKQRLESGYISELKGYEKSGTIRDIEAYLKKVSDGKRAEVQPKGVELEEKVVRETIKQIKFSLDDKVVAELWSGMVLQRQLYILGLIALGSLLAMVLVVLYETCRLPSCLGCDPAASGKHGVHATVLAGLLGGALSTISQPMAQATSLPLVKVALIRPLIGAIAGLFLFLVSGQSDILKFSYPFLYAAAIAIGFSERAFAALMGAAADEISKGVSRALGVVNPSKGRSSPSSRP